MPIPLPNLDDRRWADLVEEGRSLIPLYAPQWTDHNASDPGITLLELFASIAEMDIYEINRVPDRHKRKFLALAGIASVPPRPARAGLRFAVRPPAVSCDVPAGTESSGADPNGFPTVFRTLADLTVNDAELRSVLSFDSSTFLDLTGRWTRGEPLNLMGAAPAVGAALYLGFDRPLPPAAWTSLFFLTASGERINSRHYSARTVWERLGSGSQWTPIAAEDQTRSLTQTGGVRLKPGPMIPSAAGPVKTPLYYVRVRLSQGQFDAAPAALRVTTNTVEAEQSIPISETWPIRAGAVITGAPPAAGETAPLRASFNTDGQVTQLAFGPAPDAASFSILNYHAPTTLTLRARRIGIGTGAPYQTVILPGAPIDQPTLILDTNEAGSWIEWARQEDLSASGPADSHYLLNPTSGAVVFGDGANGRVPPSGAWIVAQYRTTRGAAGNLPAGSIHQLPASGVLQGGIASVVNPSAAYGGEDAESLAHTIGRAIQTREAALRAVTLSDYETLAAETPGTKIARVTTVADVYPGFDCMSAPGVVTVLVVPSLPPLRPSPSAGLSSAVAGYLEPRRIIGTRVVVTGPDYVEIAVQARVRAFPTASKAQLRQALVNALNAFLDPLSGGPDGTGWPFGRDLYRTEIMQVIDRTAGVDHVESLALVADGCGPMCGNICLKPWWLVTPGAHQIEVV